jgi:VWFA-related protein
MIARIAALLFLALPLFAQGVPGLGETVEVSIVNVDVFVTDREGRRVRGLTQNDFEIYENGKLQPVSNFAEYSSALAATRAGVEGRAVERVAERREPRTIAIFLEEMRLAQHQVTPFFGSLRQFLRKTVEPGDAVSIVYWNRLDARYLEFTDDLARVERTLDGIEKAATGARLEDATTMFDEMQIVRTFAEDAKLAGNTGVGSVALPMLIARMEMKRRVHAINSVIATMSGGEGKKLLLLATRRLGRVAGAEYLHMAGADPLPAEARSESGTEDLMDRLVNNANASGVTIYPLYAPGLGHSMDDAGRQWKIPPAAPYMTLANERVNLEDIAARTGGMGAYAVSDIVKLMPEIIADTSDYYSLAYRVTAQNDDRARDITVKTKNPALRVRVREQFVEKSHDTRMKDRLTAALFTADPVSDLEFETTIGEAPKGGRRTTLPVTVRIPIAALTALPQGEGKQAGGFSVYVGTAADLDELSEFTHRTQPFTFSEEDLERSGAAHFTYDLDVVVNREAKFLVVGVLDEVSKTHGITRVELQR